MDKKRVLRCVLILFLSVCAVGGFFVQLFFLRPSPTADADALWPKNGDVIAVIDGREYRYDPLYLYRLTNAYFSDDYTKSLDAAVINGMVAFSKILYGKTQAEAAVCLELLYIDGKEQFDPEDLTENWIYANNLKYEYSYMRSASFEKPYREDLIARHEKAKFRTSQSDASYIEDLAPYLEKLAYIDRMGRRMGLTEGYKPLLGVSKERFNDILSASDFPENLYLLIAEKLIKTHDVQMLV